MVFVFAAGAFEKAFFAFIALSGRTFSMTN